MKFDLTKKPLQLAVAVLIIAAAFWMSNIFSSSKQPEKKAAVKASREVEKIIVKNQAISSFVKVTGTLQAYNKAEIFAEVSGVFLNGEKQFREGINFSRGQQIIKIDDEVNRMSLQALKGSFMNLLSQIIPDIKLDYPEQSAAWAEYLLEFNINKPVKPLPEIKDSKLKYFLAGKNILNQYYSIKSQEALLDKYSIKAPFNGIVTESNIKPGTLVRVGQKLGELTNTSLFEMEASVKTNEIGFVKTGQKVILNSNDSGLKYTGKVVRINNKIDQPTQTVKVYIESSDVGLLDGMFMTGEIMIGELEQATFIPRKLINKENQLFVIENNRLKILKVEIIKLEDEHAIIKGLNEGTVVLAETVADAHDGMLVN